MKNVWGICILLAGLPIFPATAGLDMHGFADARVGTRIDDPDHRSLTEFRLQLERELITDRITLQLRGDLVYDELAPPHAIDLESGAGWLDLREAHLQFAPSDLVDVKAGRQILTWGTGDLLFINDLFPKDWVSFFSGRDVEYLKAPSDAILISAFPAFANLDLVYTPRFDADRHLTGERISFYPPSGPGVVRTDQPDEVFGDDEWALRVYRNVAGYELALYGYDGFWKSPAGQQPERGRATFPRLRVYGASVRGTLAGGIAHAEAGYYDSRDDHDDPNVRNSETRLLAGYEHELARNLTMGLQYYVEIMSDYAAYRDSLPEAFPAADEDRHVLTARLTRQLMDQNLTLSLVGFWSPSDQDGYLRPHLDYKVTDDWLVTAGGNLFFGQEDHTFFGQFEDNNNLYAGVRYSF